MYLLCKFQSFGNIHFSNFHAFCFYILLHSDLDGSHNVIFTNIPLFTNQTNCQHAIKKINICSNLLKNKWVIFSSKTPWIFLLFISQHNFATKSLGFVAFCHKTVVFWHQKQHIHYLNFFSPLKLPPVGGKQKFFTKIRF